MIACFGMYLVCIHLVLLLFLENLFSSISITARHLLNNCSIPLNTCLFYWDFWVCSQYLSKDSPIHQAKFFGVSLCSIVAWYLLWFIEIFCPWYLLDTSRSIEIFFSIEARYLLNLSSYVFFIYFWGPTRFCTFSNITSLSTQTPSFH